MGEGGRRTDITISRSLLPILVAGGLLVGACGDDGTTPDGSAADDVTTTDTTLPADEQPAADPDGDWVLISGSIGGDPIGLVDGRDVTLSVAGTEIGGTAACNSYGGSVDLGDGTWVVMDLAWTEMACEPAVMDLEQSYVRGLAVATTYAIDDGVLTLSGPAVELTFDPVAPMPDADIVGTAWVLDTVIEGDAASSSSIMASASLTLDEDGTLSGSTGCRLFEGEWTAAGAEIVFTTFLVVDDPLVGVCASDSEALDGFVIGVLEGGFVASVDGSRLTLTEPGGDGLSYSAG